MQFLSLYNEIIGTGDTCFLVTFRSFAFCWSYTCVFASDAIVDWIRKGTQGLRVVCSSMYVCSSMAFVNLNLVACYAIQLFRNDKTDV